MHGLRSRVDEETDRTSNERRTDDSGSLASGAVSALRGSGGRAFVCGCHTLEAETEATEDRELLVLLTSLVEWAAALRGTRTEGAAFMADS
jgi:hypothetical protein